jgi:hypothetical protein
MNTIFTSVLALLLVAVAGCAGNPMPQASTPGTASNAPTASATKPDDAKFGEHLQKHVKYPATRAELLAACANTNEFTEGERKWFADRLPEGTYASAADVTKALAPK